MAMFRKMSDREETADNPPTMWGVRGALKGTEAGKKYNEYLAEYARNIRNLEREANGELPSKPPKSYR